jgi:hypothetical protein
MERGLPAARLVITGAKGMINSGATIAANTILQVGVVIVAFVIVH